MSYERFTSPEIRKAYQEGNQRWDGDGYASSSIWDTSDQDDWRFCTKPEP